MGYEKPNGFAKFAATVGGIVISALICWTGYTVNSLQIGQAKLITTVSRMEKTIDTGILPGAKASLELLGTRIDTLEGYHGKARR